MTLEQEKPSPAPWARADQWQLQRPDHGHKVIVMTWGNILVGASVLMLVTPPARAADQKAPIILEPSSPWTMDYAEDYCRLGRAFGTGDQAMRLLIERFSPGDSFRMTLIGQPAGAIRYGGEAKIRFGAAPEQDAAFFSGSWTGDIPAMIFSPAIRISPRTKAEQNLVAQSYKKSGTFFEADIAPIAEADEHAANELYVGDPLRQPLVLRTGSMKEPFAAMRACTDELLSHWGIDVARHRELAAPARPAESPGRWITSQDYPWEMLRKSQSGIVQFRLTVGEDGKPTACHIQQSTNAKGFDEASCKILMSRARFEPARDQDGKPLISYHINTIQFRIPR